MKVKNLIDELYKLDQEADIWYLEMLENHYKSVKELEVIENSICDVVYYSIEKVDI